MADLRIIECEQGSPEWFKARAGLPTASEFATVMASGRGGAESKTRRTYMLKLAGEILTGEPMDSFSNSHMERGKEMEAEARDLYAFMADVDPVLAGFLTDGAKGCSPDALIGDIGGAEIKTKLPHLQIDVLLRGELPPEHRAQTQGSLWVSGREWWDFVSYWPRLPIFIHRVYRDEPYIAEIAAAVDQFNDELAACVERIRNIDPNDRKEAA